MKILPKEDERKRKHKKPVENNQVTKKPRQEEPPVTFSGLDLTEVWVNERLLPIVATQIIMDTLVCNLPEKFAKQEVLISNEFSLIFSPTYPIKCHRCLAQLILRLPPLALLPK